MAHLRATLILATWGLLLLLGTPGLDFLDASSLRSPDAQVAWRARVPEPWAGVGIALAQANRAWRLPAVAALTPLQRPFRVSQEWFLYRDGPSKVRRLEVRVDGDLLHRSADPAYPWLADVLRNRRIRPVVESTCGADAGPNWRGLARLVVARARLARPDAKSVELACTVAAFPGTDARIHRRYVATEPAWDAAPA
jgi:hypothetical protein